MSKTPSDGRHDISITSRSRDTWTPHDTPDDNANNRTCDGSNNEGDERAFGAFAHYMHEELGGRNERNLGVGGQGVESIGLFCLSSDSESDLANIEVASPLMLMPISLPIVAVSFQINGRRTGQSVSHREQPVL